MKRTPLNRKRATPRRTTFPRCSVRGCDKRATLRGWCISHAEQVADRAFSRWVRDRDGKCTAAGILEGDCKGILQAAHYIGRRNHSVRFDAWNVHALCMAHHYTVDQHGQEHAKHRWIAGVIGEPALDILHRQADVIVKRYESIDAALSWLLEREAS